MAQPSPAPALGRTESVVPSSRPTNVVAQQNVKVEMTFAVPLMLRRIEGAELVNEGLRRIVLEHEKAEPGTTKSNFGGWHSAGNMLDWPGEEVLTLKQWIREAVEYMCSLPARRDASAPKATSYAATAWANVNRNGNYNNLHNHPRQHWALVYYVTLGEETPGFKNNGRLEIRDPRPGSRFYNPPGYRFGLSKIVNPRPGLMLMFPAWVEHWVHPFFGTGDRISIACNIKIKGGEKQSDYD